MFFVTLEQVIIMLLLMLVGLLCVKIGFIHEKTVTDMTQVLLYIISPCLILKAFQEGDMVKLDREVFGDFEGKIIKFDRGRKRAQIEFDFDGRKQNVWCGVDMIRMDK